ncbi:NDR1/HIN1-like protein 2 [Telopea speciosissima]|uniref:NDR1/HIN1-like protein 2 n=1 Tax=Telopea speciosissima TaxID=54955 RepID=UPI001CC58DD2|nr:NDR1/HIN1-like protein 2 [Telopea speciosissima]
MASKYDDDQTKMRTGYPGMGYPPPPLGMGYPPPTPPAAAAGYPGYPNTHNVYPYAAAPPAAYYNNEYPVAAASPYNSGPYGFLRQIIIGMITTFVIIGMLYFLIWLMIRPRYPVVQIDSLVVSNFTITDSKLDTDWDLSFNIWNPNRKLDMNYKEIDTLIFYGRNLLSTTTSKPFFLEKKNMTTVNEKLVTRKDFVGAEMENERKSGSLLVSVRFRVSATFQKGDSVSREFKMGVLCEYLRIDFAGNTSTGKLAPGTWTCLLYEV